MNERMEDLLLRQVEERRKDPEFMERLGRIMCDDAEVLDKLAAGERADAIPDAACEAYLQAATGPPGDATVFERVRRGLATAAPFLRAAHPEAGSEEAERSIRLQQLRADIGQVRSLIEVIGDPNDVGPFGNGWRAALHELEQQIELRWGRAARPEADRAPEGPAKDSITDWPKEER